MGWELHSKNKWKKLWFWHITNNVSSWLIYGMENSPVEVFISLLEASAVPLSQTNNHRYK